VTQRTDGDVAGKQVLERYRDAVPRFHDFLEAVEEPLPTTVRCNTLRTTPEELEAELPFPAERLNWMEEGFEVETDSPGNTLQYLLGKYYPQEEVSMIPPKALDPEPGEEVLDMCAAPGSKTTQVAAAMENTGTLVANDISIGRIAPLKTNLERLGILNCRVTRVDATRYPGSEEFDRVLLDPACSSEGTTRKDPTVLHDADARRGSHPVTQRKMMKRAARLLRPGGTLVYSTCTYAPEENEAVVRVGLDEGLELDEMRDIPEGEPGLTSWNGEEFPEEMKLCNRYYPHLTGTGGFFVARMMKPC